MRRLAGVLVALICLGGCDSVYPGGRTGTDGSGGTGGSAGAGGTPETPMFEASLPGIEVQVRSQLWAPAYGREGLLPSGYTVALLDAPRACSPDGFRLEDGEAWIQGFLVSPAVGDCPLVPPRSGPASEDPLPPGCRFTLGAGRAGSAVTEARGGFARIDRITPDLLAGAFHLQLPATPMVTEGCAVSWSSSGDEWEFMWGECACRGADGDFTCTLVSGEDLDCCDDDLPLVEVVVPFEATRCAQLTWCGSQPCAPYLVDSCARVPAAPACEAACADYVSICEDCIGGPSPEWRGSCDPDRCLETCRSLGTAEPLVSLSLACVETAATCDDWVSCVAACGEP